MYLIRQHGWVGEALAELEARNLVLQTAALTHIEAQGADELVRCCGCWLYWF